MLTFVCNDSLQSTKESQTLICRRHVQIGVIGVGDDFHNHFGHDSMLLFQFSHSQFLQLYVNQGRNYLHGIDTPIAIGKLII